MLPVLKKSLRDSRGLHLWLVIGLGAYTLLIMSFYPTIVEQSEEIDKLIDSMPDQFIAMFVGDDLTDISVSDPGIFLNGRFVIWTMLILGAVGINQAFSAVTNAERDGTLDFMLSLPVSRRSYLVGRMINTAITMLIVLTSSLLILLLAREIWPEFDIAVDKLALAVYGMFLVVIVIAAVAYLLAALLPASRNFGGAMAYLFMMGSYLVYSLSETVEGLDKVQPFLIFHYYNASRVVRDGAEVGNWLLLAALALVCFGVAWWAIDRKDLAV
ncbi:MAG: ABC transporter permease subunit [Chloroflexi bacterium]|nr:ABC transporter permease subunit [Chloroflexota bacterium]